MLRSDSLTVGLSDRPSEGGRADLSSYRPIILSFPRSTMRRLHHNLPFPVLVAISLGVLLVLVAPGTAKAMKPVGDTFINLVKMVITPVIFLTIVLGIANMADLRKVGRVGGKALLYFEIVTTFALAI